MSNKEIVSKNVWKDNNFALKDDAPAEAHIHARVTLARKNRYVLQAQREGLKLSEWQQKHLDKVCDAADRKHKREAAKRDKNE